MQPDATLQAPTISQIQIEESESLIKQTKNSQVMNNPFAIVNDDKPNEEVHNPDSETPEPAYTSATELRQQTTEEMVHTTKDPKNGLRLDMMTPELGENVVINVQVPEESNQFTPPIVSFPIKSHQVSSLTKEQVQSPIVDHEDMLRMQKMDKVHCHTDGISKKVESEEFD